MLAYLRAQAPDALCADFWHYYSRPPQGMSVSDAADCARWLPDGAAVWRALDKPAAWTVEAQILALLFDLQQMDYWRHSDKRQRGRRPDPLPRPGVVRANRNGVVAMSKEDVLKFMSQDFVDITPEEAQQYG